MATIGFNPRSRKGSDLHGWLNRLFDLKFQSTLPQGERPLDERDSWTCLQVSIHAPARGATYIRCCAHFPITLFQSTLPQGERPFGIITLLGFFEFQSTLPQGERQILYLLRFFDCTVSIHAPARGATEFLKRKRLEDEVSIHAPARGATRCHNQRQRVQLPVSIHAPARGATDIEPRFLAFFSRFNPRSRKGSDSLFIS